MPPTPAEVRELESGHQLTRVARRVSPPCRPAPAALPRHRRHRLHRRPARARAARRRATASACLARHPEQLRDQPWAGDVEVVRGDAARRRRRCGRRWPASTSPTTWSTRSGTGRRSSAPTGDTRAAFAGGRARRGVRPARLPRRPRPRRTGRGALAAPAVAATRSATILLGSGVPTAVLRAAVIIGSGSASFEMLRYLTERLPAMVTPRWVDTRIQPIAIRDVLRYLVGCAALPADVSPRLRHRRPRRADLPADDAALRRRRRAARGGSSCRCRCSRRGCRATGSAWSRRCRARSPARWSSRCGTRWSAAEHDIADYVPDPPERAARLRPARSSWPCSGSGTPTWRPAGRRRRCPGAPSDPLPTDPDWAGGSLYVDRARAGRWRPPPRRCGGWSRASAASTAGTPSRWPGGSAACSTGSSAGSGCAAAGATRTGSTSARRIDFWRVEERDPGELLRLRAEMRLPGLAWLELGVEREPALRRPRSTYVQRALFHPRGLLGHALLVGGRAVPRHRVRRHGPQHRRRRRGARTHPRAHPRRSLIAAPRSRGAHVGLGRAGPAHPVAGVVLVDDRGGVAELVPLVVREQPGLVQVGVVQRRPAPRRTGGRRRRAGRDDAPAAPRCRCG